MTASANLGPCLRSDIAVADRRHGHDAPVHACKVPIIRIYRIACLAHEVSKYGSSAPVYVYQKSTLRLSSEPVPCVLWCDAPCGVHITRGSSCAEPSVHPACAFRGPAVLVCTAQPINQIMTMVTNHFRILINLGILVYGKSQSDRSVFKKHSAHLCRRIRRRLRSRCPRFPPSTRSKRASGPPPPSR